MIGSDGTEAEVDTIIFGTGFHVTDTPAADIIHGVGGRSLRDVWGPSMHAHRGTTIAGFPNMFMLGGPHTGIGHTSLTVMIEAQVELRDRRAAPSSSGAARPDRGQALRAQEAFLAELDRQHGGHRLDRRRLPVLVPGPNGRNTTLWPDFTFRYRERWRASTRASTTAPARVPVA